MPETDDVTPGEYGGDLPKPLQDILDVLTGATTVSDVLSQVTERLNTTLVNSGVGVEIARHHTNGLSDATEIATLKTKIIAAYETSMSPTGTPHNTTTIAPRMYDVSDVRVALAALRESPDFERLKQEKIWLLATLDLKNKLESTLYNAKCHWYMILIRIMRFHDPKAVNGAVIAINPLRDFLCDYVFGVPREEFVGKPRGRRPGGNSHHRVTRTPRVPKVVITPTLVRPVFDSIPEEQTQTYDDLLKWLRLPQNESFVFSLTEAVRLARSRYSAYDPASLHEKIVGKFKPGFLGHAVIMLAHYLKPEFLVQDFIGSIRSPKGTTTPRPPEPQSLPQRVKTPTSPPEVLDLGAPKPHKPAPRVFVPPKSHPHQGAPFIPGTPPPARESQSDTRRFPEFATLQRGIEWLRSQAEFQALAQEACSMSDDKAIAAMLIKKSPLLLSVLLALKTKFGASSTKNILEQAFPQYRVVETPVTEEKIVPGKSETGMAEVVVTEEEPEEENNLQLTPEHKQRIIAIFDLHKQKKYREFWESCQRMETGVFGEILEVQKAFGHQNWIQSMAYIAGYTMTAAEVNLYIEHHWSKRLFALRGVRSQIEKLLVHDNSMKESVIKSHLVDAGEFSLPLNLREKWHGFDELDMQRTKKRNLFDMVLELVKSRKAYQKGDEGKTKKLIHVIKQIAGQVSVTADDEEIEIE